jgi:cellobiose-specific phosphotransferase system component IIA
VPGTTDGFILEWRKLQLLHDWVADTVREGLADEAKPLIAEARTALERSRAEISKVVGLPQHKREALQDARAQVQRAQESLAEARRLIKRAHEVAESARLGRNRARRMRARNHEQRQRIRKGRDHEE